MRRFPAPLLCSFLLILGSCHINGYNKQIIKIDEAFRLSIQFISGQSARVYHSLLQKQADPSTRNLSLMWSTPAFEAKEISAHVLTYLDSVHAKMSKEGSLSAEDKKALFDTLLNCKLAFLHVFPDSLDPGGYYLAKDRENLQRWLPLLHGYPDPNLPASRGSWADSLFQGDTAMAALALHKLAIDLLLSEQAIATYCDNQATSTIVRFDRFEPLISLNSSIAAPGDTIELKAGIGTFSASVRPKITIAESQIPVNPNGMSAYIFTAPKKPGRYAIPVTIVFTKADGDKDTLKRVVHYQVRG